MFDSDNIISTLTSIRARDLISHGRLVVQPAASQEQLQVLYQNLPKSTVEQLLPLVTVATGFKLSQLGRGLEDYIEFSFIPVESSVTWPAIYPIGMDVAFGLQSELLIADLTDSLGLIYHVSHDPPSHTICFESLLECIRHVINTDEPLSDISTCVTGDGDIPTISNFVADSTELATFLSRFPAHYLVHDLREWTVGAGFPYYTCNQADWARYGQERLWVQRTPRGALERLKWFWRTGSLGY